MLALELGQLGGVLAVPSAAYGSGPPAGASFPQHLVGLVALERCFPAGGPAPENFPLLPPDAPQPGHRGNFCGLPLHVVGTCRS